MKRRVIITGPAESDILQNYEWWAKHRSPVQAKRWLIGIYHAIFELANTAEIHSFASEIVLEEAGIRQAGFGLGNRSSHRIIYGIESERVIAYRVRAFKQDTIDLSDLDG